MLAPSAIRADACEWRRSWNRPPAGIKSAPTAPLFALLTSTARSRRRLLLLIQVPADVQNTGLVICPAASAARWCSRRALTTNAGSVIAALPPDLIGPLSSASNVPRFPPANGVPGAVKDEALPTFFRKWAGTAWTGLLAELPDEDSAELGTDAANLAADEFRRLVREALLTPIVLGQSVAVGRQEDNYFETKLEKRPLANWCERFAKSERWADVRELKI